MRVHGLVGVLMSAAVAGCALGPNYQRPDLASPAQWSGVASSQPAEPETQPADLTTWWKTLDDPTLNTLIERAMQSNLELQIAAARVREARAQRAAAIADFWPQINLDSGYTYRGSSRNTQPKTSDSTSFGKQLLNQAVNSALSSLGLGRSSGTGSSGNTDPTATLLNELAQKLNEKLTEQDTGTTSRGLNLFQAGLDASWELDLFGGVRRSVEAADAGIQVYEEARRGVLVSLLAEVAVNYIELRGFQWRLEIARKNLQIQQKTLELTRQRYRLTGPLDVAQAEAQLETTRSQLPVLGASILKSIYRLGVLLGETPGALLDQLSSVEAMPSAPPQVPIGLPSDLLRRRPDIREAERALAAATAQIGVATADLFPHVSLTGSFGTQTSDIAHFFDRNSLFWSVGPSIQWPIFEGGRTLANIESRSAQQEQALAQYKQTVLNAFEEVEKALAEYDSERTRQQALTAAAAANERATKFSNDLYAGGLADFLNVLVSQQSLHDSQDQLAQSNIAAMTDLIVLYKALGGGWEGEKGDILLFDKAR